VQCTQTRVRALTSGPPRSTAPTCRSDRDTSGADRPALADGELAGGAATTSISPATRRTRCTKRRHGRSLEWSLATCMAEWRRGSSAVRRLRPWQGAGRRARVSLRQGGAHALERKERGRAERGCPHGAKLRRGRAYSDEELPAEEDLPRRTDSSTGCERWRRCCWRDGDGSGALERPEQPTQAMAHGGGKCCGCCWHWRSEEEHSAVRQMKARSGVLSGAWRPRGVRALSWLGE